MPGRLHLISARQQLELAVAVRSAAGGGGMGTARHGRGRELDAGGGRPEAGSDVSAGVSVGRGYRGMLDDSRSLTVAMRGAVTRPVAYREKPGGWRRRWSGLRDSPVVATGSLLPVP